MSAGNPYDPSVIPPGGPGGYDPNAASKVSGPATALIVVGVLNILLALYGVVSNVMALSNPAQIQAQIDQNPELQNIEGFDPAMITKFAQAGGAMGVVLNIVAVVVAIVIIIGALKMKKLESRGMAMTASILAMIPCLSACCLLGLPIGIWSIVTLNDPNVRASFRS